MGQENVKDYKKFLFFTLDNQQFGIDILKTVSIIKYDIKITRVPRAPTYIKGVINIRGRIVPIINLRKKLGLDEIIFTKEVRIIILEVENDFFGIIVDKVSGVSEIDCKYINDITNINNNKLNDYISNVCQKDEKIMSILNIKKIIDVEVYNNN